MTTPPALRFRMGGNLLMVAAVITLCTLGYWQIERLQWKTGLITALQSEYDRNPLTKPLDRGQLQSLSQQETPLSYASLYGEFLHQHEMKLGPRTHEGTPGYHLITPLRIAADDSFVLVNRGWIPLTQGDAATPALARPNSPVLLTGLVRRPDRPNRFTPPNDPAHDIWYSLNTAEIEAKTGLSDVPPVVFYAESQSPALNAAYPLMAPTRTLPANNHRQYAIFWFGMAALFGLLYSLLIVKTLKNKKTH